MPSKDTIFGNTYLNKKEATKRYNCSWDKINDAVNVLLKEDNNKAKVRIHLKFEKDKVTKVSKEYLDEYFEWHRLQKIKKKKFTISIVDIYWWLCKHRWSKEKKERITREKYKIFITEFFSLIMDKIVIENWIWHLPYKMGSIYIKKIFKENLSIAAYNKKHKIETGEKVRYSNKHSFGYRFSIRFDRTFATFINKGLLTFRAAGSSRQKLKNAIFDGVPALVKSYKAH